MTTSGTVLVDRGNASARRPYSSLLFIWMAGLAGISMTGLLSGYLLQIAFFVVIYALISQGLGVIWGDGGILSLCHTALFGLAAYTTAILGVRFLLPIGVVFVLALVVPVVVAVLVGIIGLKRISHSFSILTLAVLLSLGALANQWNSVTGGPNGFPGVKFPNVRIGSFSLNLANHATLYVLGVIALIAIFSLHSLLMAGRFGRATHAVRDNEIGAAAIGISTHKVRVQLIVLSAIGPAVAGFLFVGYTTFTAPDLFGVEQLLRVLVIVVLAGSRSTQGIIVSSLVVIGSVELLRVSPDYQALLYGVVVLVLMRLAPNGFVSAASDFLRVSRRILTNHAPRT